MRHALIPMLPVVFIASALCSGPALADVARGQRLHEEKCAGCHKAPHNAAFYTSRVGKKYPTKDSLKTMVQSCVTYFDVPWFEEEVQAVTDYLNHTYYRAPRKTVTSGRRARSPAANPRDISSR